MFPLKRNSPLLERAREYASPEDFCRIFKNEMGSLYWLALILTLDEDKAEQCFVVGLEECISGNAVFKEWARSWSRRVVIKKAIQLISPTADTTYHAPVIGVGEKLDSNAKLVLTAVRHLQPFDRFVFVISVLESYADRECAALLGCTPSDVVEARIRALQVIQKSASSSREAGSGQTQRVPA